MFAPHAWVTLVLVSLAACGSPGSVEPLFTLAVIADPHVDSDTSYRVPRLQAAVDFVNAEAAARDIQLVLVAGDVGWRTGLPKARELLDGLALPYVPISGDNEIHDDSEELFDTVFASHYAELATELDGWQHAATPVAHPIAGVDAWLQNFAFDYGGVRIVGLDWAARGVGGLEGELADLHDFAGGTLPWLTDHTADAAQREPGSILLLTHMPMHEVVFADDEMATLRQRLAGREAAMTLNLAGHMHLNYDRQVVGLYDVYVTAPTWTDPAWLRLVHVGHDGAGFVYDHELIQLN